MVAVTTREQRVRSKQEGARQASPPTPRVGPLHDRRGTVTAGSFGAFSSGPP